MPEVALIEGLRLSYRIPSVANPSELRQVEQFLVIGRAGPDSFFLAYDRGVTRWNSPADLSEPLRRKILHALRTQARHASSLPAWCREVDLTGHPPSVALDELSRLYAQFHQDRWRAQVLGDRDEDYVDLVVPFSEKDAAKAAGAVWDSARRVWRANLALNDRSALQRWLPAPEQEGAVPQVPRPG